MEALAVATGSSVLCIDDMTHLHIAHCGAGELLRAGE
jgi:hypothetical protein